MIIWEENQNLNFKIWTEITCFFVPEPWNKSILLDIYVMFTGEQGNGVSVEKEKLAGEERKKYDDGWQNNAFNQYVSDQISLHRSLKDVRDAE